ncbi:hypothetical protein ABIE27_003751 [Paenibacillus sp. 4624]|uniref:PD-(D/E)XK nuclease domain-containing protein n=1 Tax=Paenibacillus sp. 4624 TaxID=3156453 RepID=UPI003D1C1305
MNQEEAIKRIEQQISNIEVLRRVPRGASSPEFSKWHRDTQIIITKIFGEKTRHINDFDGISYHVNFFSSNTPDSYFDKFYQEGLDEVTSILQSFAQEINDFGISAATINKLTSFDSVLKICHRFHKVARQLRSRHSDRPTLEINDEYDVQDLFHSLLLLDFDDVRPEEWTPSYAGSSSRVDFLLKKEQIIIEIKKTRKGLAARDVGEQLLVDIQKYQSHPDCKMLICFVYDPENKITNPYGIENDLSREFEGIPVKVIINPK